MDKAHDVQKIVFVASTMILHVHGRKYEVDLARCSQRLAAATQQQREHIEVSPSGYGIHWPEIDEDLSIDNLIRIAHAESAAETPIRAGRSWGDLTVFHLNAIGMITVVAGLVVGYLTMFVFVLAGAKNPLMSGISTFTGSAATSLTDFAYRVLNHREKGVVRLVRDDCGGAYLSIPMWVLGLVLLVAFGYSVFFA
jgi:hypothetical protein